MSERPGLWQSVEPAERRSQVVMLPELAEHGQLIDALELASPVITPNGDGVNDALDMRFVVFKLDAAVPTLALYDLAGRQVAAVESMPTAMGHRFTWTGSRRVGDLSCAGHLSLPPRSRGRVGAGERTRVRSRLSIRTRTKINGD